MSDVQPTPEDQGESTPAETPVKGTSPLRLVLLLLIFGLALAGLLYDYCIARPGVKKADATILGLLDGSIPDPNGDGTVTEDEVQDKLGRKPTSTKQLTNGKIEVYSWRSGLPYRVYKLYVVYSGQKMPLLYSATTNEEPKGDKLPPVTVIADPMTQEELDNFVPLMPQGAGAGSETRPEEKPKAPKSKPGGAKTPSGSLTMEAPTPETSPSKEAAGKKDEPGKEKGPAAGEQQKKEKVAKPPKTEETTLDAPETSAAGAQPPKKEAAKEPARKEEKPAEKADDDPAKKKADGS